MSKSVQREMATRVSVDTVGAVKSFKAFTEAVKANTSSWKSQEAQLKSAGNYEEAAKAKMEGLTKSIDLQKAKVEELRTRQQGLDRSTKDGQESFFKLEDQINKANRSMASMDGQLTRAKSSFGYYNSGLADLQKGYKSATSLSKSYVERLEAEGKSAEANKAKLSGYQNSVSNLSKQYEIQQNELKRVASESGLTSEAYRKQQTRVNETATSLSKAKTAMGDLSSEMKRANTSAFSRAMDSAKEKLGLVRKEEEQTKNSTSHFALGAAIGRGLSSAASSAIGYIKSVTVEGYKLAEAGGTIKKQWTNLGLSDADATKMTAQIGDIRSKANMSGGAIDQMQKKFYAMTNSSSKARDMTEVLASYGSAAGKSGDQIAAMSQGVAKLSGSSKVTASLFKRSFSQVPELQKAIVKASGMSTSAFSKQLSAGKITGTQLQGYMVKAAKTSGKAWSEFADTPKGKMAELQGTYTNMKVAFAKPLVSGIEKAIDGISKKKGSIDKVKDSITKLVGKLGEKAGQYVGDVISFLAKNEKPIEHVGGAVASIVGSLEKGAWATVASALKMIGGHSKEASRGMNGIAGATENVAKHKGAIESVGKALVTYFVVSKLKSVASGFLSIAGGIGKAIGFMRTLSSAQRAAAKATDTQTAAQKLLDLAMDANPIALVVTAIAALGLGFYEAYKHIKPFRDAVNGMGKAMKKLFTGKYNWEKSIGKKLDGVGSAISKWGKGAGKFVSKHKTEILAGIVSPFAGLSAWFLKDTKTGKNVQKWAGGFSKDIQKMGLKKAMDKQVNDASKAFDKSKFGKWFKNISSSFNSFKSSFKKGWDKHWSDTGKSMKSNWDGSVKNTKNFFSTIGKKWDGWKSSFKKSWASHWSNTQKTQKTSWDNSYKDTKKFFSSMGGKWDSWKKSWSKSWSKHWDSMRSNLNSYWNKDLKHTKVFGTSMNTWLGDFKKLFKGGWSNLGKGVSDIFSDLWKGLKKNAQNGMNDVIDIINSGINAVNSVIHTFGGKKHTIGDLSHIRLATGTGMFSGQRRAITQPTLALLNDGNDSPETGNKEAVIHSDGTGGIVQGVNTTALLRPGDEVLNATELKTMMAMRGVTRFASGTGFFGNIINSVTSGVSGVTSWVGKKVKGLETYFKTAENVIAHPIKSLENLFKWHSNSANGVMNTLGKGMFSDTEKQAKTWWKTLWNGVSSKLDDGSGSNSALVNGMEKYGAVNKYVYGATGPSAFDCSGLVQYTLKKMGISFPRTSGEQYAASKRVSNPKAGDLVFFGSKGSEHVGVYTGNGEFYSAENEKSGMGTSQVHGGGYGTFAGYGRVPGLSDSSSSSSDSKSSGLLGTIQKQVGGGFWSFISKLASQFGSGSTENPGGEGVTRWHSDVVKVLKSLGLSTSSSMVSKVLRQIATESNGDPNAVGGTDGLSDGRAMGLMQVKPATFAANGGPKYGKWNNGYASIYAGLHYAKARYGSNLSFLGQGHGYENGGIVNTNQLIEVAEKNKPEMIVPLTNRTRAGELIGQAVSQLVTGESLAQGNVKDNDKQDKIIALLTALLAGQGNVKAIVAKSDVVNTVNADKQKKAQYNQMMGY